MKIFQELKDRLTSALLLTLQEGEDGFLLYCDASRIRLGCVIMKSGKLLSMPQSNLKP